MYKLRSDINIKINLDYNIFLVSNLKITELINKKNSNPILFSDPRFKNKFSRLYIDDNKFHLRLQKEDFSEVNINTYEKLRLENHIPDFSVDAIKEKSLLMEMRFEELNGISWKKGCYLGQEITARMKYRGLSKKKLFAVNIDFKNSLDKEIFLNQNKIGFLMSNNKKFGFAYLSINENTINKTFLCGDSKVKVINNLWY